jgi:hypothetical protein
MRQPRWLSVWLIGTGMTLLVGTFCIRGTGWLRKHPGSRCTHPSVRRHHRQDRPLPAPAATGRGRQLRGPLSRATTADTPAS